MLDVVCIEFVVKNDIYQYMLYLLMINIVIIVDFEIFLFCLNFRFIQNCI